MAMPDLSDAHSKIQEETHLLGTTRVLAGAKISALFRRDSDGSVHLERASWPTRSITFLKDALWSLSILNHQDGKRHLLNATKASKSTKPEIRRSTDGQRLVLAWFGIPVIGETGSLDIVQQWEIERSPIECLRVKTRALFGRNINHVSIEYLSPVRLALSPFDEGATYSNAHGDGALISDPMNSMTRSEFWNGWSYPGEMSMGVRACAVPSRGFGILIHDDRMGRRQKIQDRAQVDRFILESLDFFESSTQLGNGFDPLETSCTRIHLLPVVKEESIRTFVDHYRRWIEGSDVLKRPGKMATPHEITWNRRGIRGLELDPTLIPDAPWDLQDDTIETAFSEVPTCPIDRLHESNYRPSPWFTPIYRSHRRIRALAPPNHWNRTARRNKWWDDFKSGRLLERGASDRDSFLGTLVRVGNDWLALWALGVEAEPVFYSKSHVDGIWRMSQSGRSALFMVNLGKQPEATTFEGLPPEIRSPEKRVLSRYSKDSMSRFVLPKRRGNQRYTLHLDPYEIVVFASCDP